MNPPVTKKEFLVRGYKLISCLLYWKDMIHGYRSSVDMRLHICAPVLAEPDNARGIGKYL